MLDANFFEFNNSRAERTETLGPESQTADHTNKTLNLLFFKYYAYLCSFKRFLSQNFGDFFG